MSNPDSQLIPSSVELKDFAQNEGIEYKGCKKSKDGETFYLYQFSNLKKIDSSLKKVIAQEKERVSGGMVNAEYALSQFEANAYILYASLDRESRMAGYATVFPDEEDKVYLNKIQVAPDMRKKGVAANLLRQVMADFDYVHLINTVSDEQIREAMAKLYSRLGFHTTDGISYHWSREDI